MRSPNPVRVRTALLLELARGPGFGLEIIERVRARTGLALRQPTVYPELQLLRIGGLATTTVKHRPGQGGRPTMIFALTEKGLTEARRLVVAIAKMTEGVRP